MNINLNDLSIKELKSLKGEVDKAIATYEERKRLEALMQMEEKARELGFSLRDLLKHSVKKGRAPVAPKFANPENPAITWSGRGRKPQWFIEALESGKTAEDMMV